MWSKRIIYFPLEPYEERYTAQLSAPNGWLESKWTKHNIPFVRIQGESQVATIQTRKINHGQVLDAVGRSRWCANQLLRFYDMVENGEIKPGDVLYFDDFWHPGAESIRYMTDQGVFGTNVPLMFAYCWAQSADRYDFTNKMRTWIRHFEKGLGNIYDGVFVANSLLRDLLDQAEISPAFQTHVVGLPFDSEQVRNMMGDKPFQKKKNQVIFSSRCDHEKRPAFFVKIAAEYAKRYQDDTKFIVCTSRKEASQDHVIMGILDDAKEMPNFTVMTGLAKQEYYDLLCESKVQVNTSLQDWVSFTLLEAKCAMCRVVYPNERSFPETFSNMKENTYGRDFLVNFGNIEEVVHNIHWRIRINDPLDGTERAIKHGKERDWPGVYSNYVETHDQAWNRMVQMMGFNPYDFKLPQVSMRVYASQPIPTPMPFMKINL